MLTLGDPIVLHVDECGVCKTTDSILSRDIRQFPARIIARTPHLLLQLMFFHLLNDFLEPKNLASSQGMRFEKHFLDYLLGFPSF